MEKIAGDRVHAKAEEVTNLCAGDEDGDAVGETGDDGAWKVLDGCAHASDTENDEKPARHHGAEEKTFDPVFADDASDNYNEGSRGATDLRFGAAKGRDDESGDDRAVETVLRREA